MCFQLEALLETQLMAPKQHQLLQLERRILLVAEAATGVPRVQITEDPDMLLDTPVEIPRQILLNLYTHLLAALQTPTLAAVAAVDLLMAQAAQAETVLLAPRVVLGQTLPAMVAVAVAAVKAPQLAAMAATAAAV